MSKHTERAQDLRDLKEPHYNCTQAVVLAFEEDFNLPHEIIFQLTDNFIQGMRTGKTCGAVIGGTMVLSLYGITDNKVINQYFKRIAANHNGMLNCSDLLRTYYREGHQDKKPHCDGMIRECIELVETILQEQAE